MTFRPLIFARAVGRAWSARSSPPTARHQLPGAGGRLSRPCVACHVRVVGSPRVPRQSGWGTPLEPSAAPPYKQPLPLCSHRLAV